MQFDRITDFKNREDSRFCAAKKRFAGEDLRDVNGDFLLPDYLPDAKKILRTAVTPRLRGRFLGSGCLEYDGTLSCDLLYFAEDCRLRCASFELPFEGKFESEEITGDCVDLLSPLLSGVTCRMQGPRKFNLRCKAGAKALLFCRDSVMPVLAPGTDGESGKAIETLLREGRGVNVTDLLETELTCSEDLPLEKTMPPIDGIVSTHAEVLFDRVRPGSDGVTLRGRAELECLYYTETGGGETAPAESGGDEIAPGAPGAPRSEKTAPKESYTVFRRSIPLEEVLDGFTVAEGDRNENCRVAAFGCVQSLKVTPAEDENGQMRTFEVDLVYSADVRCFAELPVQITEDAYSLRESCALTKTKLHMTEGADCFSGGFSTSETVEWKTAGGRIDELLSLQILPKFSETPTATRRGDALFQGEAQVSAAGLDREGNPQLLTFTLPLRCESDIPMTEGEQVNAEISAVCVNPRVRFDPEGMSLDFETFLTAELLREKEIECVTGIAPGGADGEEARRGAEGEAILFYPDKGETLWDAAKRYRVTRDALAFENALAPGAPLPRALLIPRK